MKKINVVLFIVITAIQTLAQAPDFSKEAAEALSKYSVMNGKWEGRSWSIMQNGEKHFSNVLESIQWKLNNTIIQLEGVGKTDEGKIVHNALGILYYDPTLKKVKMQSHLQSGLSTVANFEVIEPNQKYEWWFEDGRGGTIKYKISIDNGNWKEDGEYSREGMQPSKFFEMNLKKVE